MSLRRIVERERVRMTNQDWADLALAAHQEARIAARQGNKERARELMGEALAIAGKVK